MRKYIKISYRKWLFNKLVEFQDSIEYAKIERLSSYTFLLIFVILLSNCGRNTVERPNNTIEDRFFVGNLEDATTVFSGPGDYLEGYEFLGRIEASRIRNRLEILYVIDQNNNWIKVVPKRKKDRFYEGWIKTNETLPFTENEYIKWSAYQATHQEIIRRLHHPRKRDFPIYKSSMAEVSLSNDDTAIYHIVAYIITDSPQSRVLGLDALNGRIRNPNGTTTILPEYRQHYSAKLKVNRIRRGTPEFDIISLRLIN